jgi:hypothetical protein
MSNFTVQQFAVGSQDEVFFYLHVVVTVVSVLPVRRRRGTAMTFVQVYAVVTRGNVPEDVYYIHGSEGSNTLRRMAADYFFTSALVLLCLLHF